MSTRERERDPEPEQVAGSVFGVAVERYESSAFPPLPGAAEQLRELCGLLAGYGFTPTVVTDPGREELRASVARWRDGWAGGGTHGPAVVVWSGHGELHREELRLIVHDTRRARDEEETYTARLLASAALGCGADQLLLLIDTCHAGAGVLESLREALADHAERSLPPGRTAWFAMVASCRPHETADGGGLLLDAVTQVLRDGPRRADGYRHEWSRRNRQVTGAAVLDAVQARWPRDAGQQPLAVVLGRDRPMFPNPRRRAAPQAELVEHLVRAARGAERVDEGWFFTGRRRALGAIVAWLKAGEPGLFLVTGSAGSGKSAVLGRISTLSSARYRADVKEHGALRPGDPDPGVGAVAASVHVRGLTVAQLALVLAEQLDLDPPSAPSALIADVERELRRPVLVVDGLDEAAPEQAAQIVDELLAPLSRLALVLLGSRARPFRPHAEPGEPLDQAISRLLRARATAVDLDVEPGTADDIRGYARMRLLAGAVPGEHAANAALAVAERAAADAGGFLFAALAVGALCRHFAASGAAGWQEALPASITSALTADLAQGPRPRAARDLMTALAWGQGNGMPARGVWEAVASALSPDGSSYGPQDVDWVLNAYGRYVVEDSDGTQAVYRLYHREFVACLTGSDDGAGPAAETALTAMRTLVGLLPGEGADADPADVNPYVLNALPAYAVLAGDRGMGLLRTLATDRSEVFRPLLADALVGLSTLLQHLGRPAGALPPLQEALEILRALVRDDPDTHLSGLLTALNYLATCQDETEDGPGAVVTSTEAVALHRQLVGASGAHRAELAMSLHNLALYSAAIGDTDSALEAATEAVRIYQVLATESPEAHTEHLAQALVGLSSKVSLTDAREGVRTSARALALYVKLARDNPVAHLVGLTNALMCHSELLAEAGDVEEARDRGRQAVDLLRPAAAVNPAAYGAQLASALNNLATQQNRTGDVQGALVSCTEAVELLRAADGRSARAELIRALGNLAHHQGQAGDPEGALATVTEALEICRDLARRNPATHSGTLVRLTVNLAAHLSETGRIQEALATAEEAVREGRKLAELAPAAYLPDLALALNNLAIQRSRAGQATRAQAAAAEAVALYRSLARDSPDVFLPTLATALLNQCAELSRDRGDDEALRTAREAVSLFLDLIVRGPATHRNGLGRALALLAMVLGQRGEHREALTAAREAVALLRNPVPEDADARLTLLGALAGLADQEALAGGRQAAVDAISEAVAILRDLARARPDGPVGDLPRMLRALARHREAAGDRAGALAAGREAVQLCLSLTADRPEVLPEVIPELCLALRTLARLGPAAEVIGACLSAEAALVDVPLFREWITCERGEFQLSLADPLPGIRTLLALASPRHPSGHPGNEPVLRARALLRAHGPLAAGMAGAAEHLWLRLDQEVVGLARRWVESPGWVAARAFWDEHAAVLGALPGTLALAELYLADETAGRYLALAQAALNRGADEAFLPYVVPERLRTWMALPTWEDSRAFLTEHAAELLREETLGFFAAAASDTEYVHGALLTLALDAGVDGAYACVTDEGALRERWRRELAGAEPGAVLSACLYLLEQRVHGQEFMAHVHMRTARVLAGEPPGSAPAPEPAPGERDAAVAELAALIQRCPGHAAELGALIAEVVGGRL
ncbi:tetratricopeptide repeat protein [Streptomyces sp. NBC_00160]|uniref:tetratricopeptide repeat protein n=1 Tax=Streptomyces sp. NBC_00160 TaxID=2903628 RepID=UPI00225151DE|nr:caspase family protein [Streptomyces sp. NBC_00160]MCX5306422.1 tetratricopeptide repeat protein [Streptomyces sp. NBC_00160]